MIEGKIAKNASTKNATHAAISAPTEVITFISGYAAKPKSIPPAVFVP